MLSRLSPWSVGGFRPFWFLVGFIGMQVISWVVLRFAQ